MIGLKTSLQVALRIIPIRFCSQWGLPCQRHCCPCGELLPHPFTLTHGAMPRAVFFLWHFPSGLRRRASPAGRYPALCFHGARTFLHCVFSEHAAAITRPTGKRVYEGKPNPEQGWGEDAATVAGNGCIRKAHEAVTATGCFNVGVSDLRRL